MSWRSGVSSIQLGGRSIGRLVGWMVVVADRQLNSSLPEWHWAKLLAPVFCAVHHITSQRATQLCNCSFGIGNLVRFVLFVSLFALFIFSLNFSLLLCMWCQWECMYVHACMYVCAQNRSAQFDLVRCLVAGALMDGWPVGWPAGRQLNSLLNRWIDTDLYSYMCRISGVQVGTHTWGGHTVRNGCLKRK